MLRNYLKIALRNLWKHRVFSFVNILGLAIGLASCMVMLLFVENELSYDRYHQQANRIYRITADITSQGKTSPLSVTPAPWAPLLKSSYPPVLKAVRLFKDKKSSVRFGDQRIYEERLFLSDSTVFDVFTFPLLKGNPAYALAQPNSAVITQEMANKYFGQTDPMGKVLEVAPGFGGKYQFTVTGVAKNLPANSHFHFNILVSLSTIGDISQWWEYFMFHTYVLLPEGYSPHQLERALPGFVEKHMGKYAQSMGRVEAHLQALTDIHLHSQLQGELEANGDITYVYIFSGIALLVLLIACINFMNLSTARSLKRAKEVGLRKVVGAQRIELIQQFMGESILLALLALLLAVGLIYLLLPFFNQFSNKGLTLDYLHHPVRLLSLFVLSLLVGVVAGSYPALVLSSFRPTEVLKGNMTTGSKGQFLRKGLIVVQFSISSSLIAGTLIIYQQLGFIQNKKLGFNREQVVVLSAPGYNDVQAAQTFKNALRQQSGIAGVAASSDVPGEVIPVNLFHGEGSRLNQNHSMQMLSVDPDFIPTLGMEMAAGRNFSPAFRTDEKEGFVLNEEAVRQLGWPSPTAAIGKKFEWVMSDKVLKSGQVIGVVRDFHLKPLRARVEPTVLLIESNRFQYLYVRVRPGYVSATLALMQRQMQQFYPEQPFQYAFLDETIHTLYQSEERLGKIFTCFAVLAILIACLGIFGLATYSAQQRIREIGIRKVLGASVVSIFTLLSTDFLQLVLLANVIGWPLSWWAMNCWLDDFAYHIRIGWWVFAVAAVLALLIALITVSFQAIKAAIANPLKSLRTH